MGWTCLRASSSELLDLMVVTLAENSCFTASTMCFTATLRRIAPFSREDSTGEDRQPDGGV